MHRFFIAPNDLTGEEVTISGGDFKHITRVLRLGPGDRIIGVLPPGREYTVEITLVGHDRLFGRVTGQARRLIEPPLEVTLAQALVKGDKLDYIIQKATELGVSRFVPLQTERSIVRLDEGKAEERRLRWQKIAQEAAEQSGRTTMPLVKGLSTLTDLILETGSYDLAFLLWEGENRRGIKSLLRSARNPQRVLLVIGPEGGFSPKEVAQARGGGLTPVSLGPRILRTETAGPVAAALLLYELGDLGGPENEDRS